MLKLILYLRGYVSLLLSGQFIERFINICMHRGLFLWDVCRTGKDSARVKMSVRAFKQTIPIARKTHTRVKILEKKGLPIRLAAYKKRTFFLIGLLLTVCFLYASSLFIWVVDIDGCKLVSETQVRSVLAELGISRGAMKRGLDAKEIQNRALLKIDGISWIWVDIRGCKANVHVLEKRPAPEILSSEPCDIVALRDGVVTEVHATEGHKAVAVGDTVLKNQVLISAVMPSERIEARFVHAAGVVYARTWYEERMTIALTESKKEFTGETRVRKLLLFGKHAVPLSLKQALPQTNCERTQSTHTLTLFGWNTGIAYQTEVYAKYNIKTVSVPRETAIARAETALDSKISGLLVDKDGVRTDAKTDVIENTDGTLTVIRTAEYKEQIGTEVGVE